MVSFCMESKNAKTETGSKSNKLNPKETYRF